MSRSLRIFRQILCMRSAQIFCNARKIPKAVDTKSLGLSTVIFSPRFSTNSEKMSGAGDQKPLVVHYEDLLQAQKDSRILIIDVREQKEIDETGKLPESIHVPMGNVVNALNLSDEEFQRKFLKPKPSKETKIILSCRAGARSASVQNELQKLGYQQAYNYVGGWSEWESKLRESKNK